MRPGAIWNWLGTTFIVIAIVMHVIALATPYYTVADFANLKEDSIKGKNLSHDEREEFLQEAKSRTTINYGMWEICKQSAHHPDGKCVFWYIDEPSLDPGTWMKGARILACIGAGIMAKSAIGIFLNLIVVSRGDRQRYLPYIICTFCCVGGFFTFVADMVIAANNSLKYLPSGVTLSDKAKDLIADELSLGWGFTIDLLSVFIACIAGAMHLVAGRFNNDPTIDGSRLI